MLLVNIINNGVCLNIPFPSINIASLKYIFVPVCILSVLLFMGFYPLNEGKNQLPAFPGAEGFGAYSEGGRGGDIIKVTNLNDSGPGSLREAVNSEGPRIIVFEVAGTITLDSTLTLSNPYITIAGQSAPPPGITIRGEQVKIETNNVVIRFIRFRPGNYNERRPEGTDWNGMDAVDIGKEDSDEVHDIILDHCSFSWATDENIGIWYSSRNVTIQNSIISEPLHLFPEHEQYPYPGQGLLIGLNSTNISILRNFFAHNYERHPYMNANGQLDFRNNIIYNAGQRVAHFQNAAGKKQTVNFVHNYIKPGYDSRYDAEVEIRRTSKSRMFNGKLFIEGNISEGRPNIVNHDNWGMVIDQEERFAYPDTIRSDIEFSTVETNTLPANELMEKILPSTGAFLPARDPIDDRLLYDVANETGRLISTPSDVFGWVTKEEVYREIDPQKSWQTTFNIDLSNPDEAHADFNNNGYTNIEEFLNGTNPRKDESGRWITDIYTPTGSSGGVGIFSSGDINYQPHGFKVHQNYPNPFSDRTTIQISVDEIDTYKLEIFNVIGQRVDLLLESRLHPGDYEMRWNAERLPSGIYFIRLSSSDDFQVNKTNLIK